MILLIYRESLLYLQGSKDWFRSGCVGNPDIRPIIGRISGYFYLFTGSLFNFSICQGASTGSGQGVLVILISDLSWAGYPAILTNLQGVSLTYLFVRKQVLVPVRVCW